MVSSVYATQVSRDGNSNFVFNSFHNPSQTDSVCRVLTPDTNFNSRCGTVKLRKWSHRHFDEYYYIYYIIYLVNILSDIVTACLRSVVNIARSETIDHTVMQRVGRPGDRGTKEYFLRCYWTNVTWMGLAIVIQILITAFLSTGTVPLNSGLRWGEDRKQTVKIRRQNLLSKSIQIYCILFPFKSKLKQYACVIMPLSGTKLIYQQQYSIDGLCGYFKGAVDS